MQYVVPSTNNLKASAEADSASTSFTFRAMQRFNRIGSDGAYVDGDDLVTHIVSRLRIDADGNVSMTQLDIEIEGR